MRWLSINTSELVRRLIDALLAPVLQRNAFLLGSLCVVVFIIGFLAVGFGGWRKAVESAADWTGGRENGPR